MTIRKPRSPGRGDWTTAAGMGGFIVLLYLAGWGSLALLVVPEQLAVSHTQGSAWG